MRLRIILLVLAVLLSGGVPAARASDTWCDVDPPVAIETPGGNVRIVYVVTAGPIEHVVHLLVPEISYVTHSVEGGRATQVHLDVTVSNAGGPSYPVTSEVWTGPLRIGTRLSEVSGDAGTAMRHQFKLQVP